MGDALGAVLIEEAGVEVCHMSGCAVEATYGKPEVGLLTCRKWPTAPPRSTMRRHCR